MKLKYKIIVVCIIVMNFFTSCSKNPLFPLISGDWDYFPLKPGNTWTYMNKDYPSTNYIETCLAETTFLEKKAIPLEEKEIVNNTTIESVTNTYFFKDGKELLIAIKDITNLFNSYLLMAELPPVEGNKWSFSKKIEDKDIGLPFLVDLILTVNGEVKEMNIEKKVLAGTFKNCAHINITMSSKVVNSKNLNDVIVETETFIDSYLAPNTGKIYEETTEKENGIVQNITVKELVSYSLK